MTDTTDIAVFSLKRNVPSKGFNLSVFPGAPFGPEVVLSLREGDDVPPATATLHTEHEGEVDELTFMKVERNGVILLLDLETANEISQMYYVSLMNDEGDLREGSDAR